MNRDSSSHLVVLGMICSLILGIGLMLSITLKPMLIQGYPNDKQETSRNLREYSRTSDVRSEAPGDDFKSIPGTP
jgi:hypothetical protein